MQEEKIVRLEAGEFVWEEIPGKGRCLVPAPYPRLEDMKVGRSYQTKQGKILRIIEIRLEGWDLGYALLREEEGHTGKMHNSIESLQECILNEPRLLGNKEIQFDCWID